MGQSKSSMEQVEGTNNLRINQVAGSDQLLVKLCRNGSEWLSPVGWVADEKGTLLDCKSDKSSSIVEIPAEFAKKLKSGDKITLSRPDSGFKSEIVWGQSPKAAPTSRKNANGATPTVQLSLEETERRAKEAEKAAANYRVQMEAASKAREAAQAAALEAARKADEALKAEADRIAEMERAAKAFEEAEKLRLDEQRRLERERRLEEERKAEEARLAEEARIKAEAERLKKERSEARKAIKTQIDAAKEEKIRLQDVLSGFKAKSEAAEADIADNDKRLGRLEKSLASAQKEEANSKASLSKEETRLNDIQSHSDKVTASMRDLEKNNEKLFKNLERAESAHEKALKEVEAAKQRAAEALNALTSVKSESDKVKAHQATLDMEKQELGKKLNAQKNVISELKASYDTARISAEKEQSGLKELKKSREALEQRLNGAKTDIARTLQDIKASDEVLSSKKMSLKQIEDMENADDIRVLMGKSAQPVSVGAKKPVPNKKPPETSEKGGFLGRFFRKAESNVDSAKPELKKDVKSEQKKAESKKSDIKKAAPPVKPKAKPVAAKTPDVTKPAISAKPLKAAPVKEMKAPIAEVPVAELKSAPRKPAARKQSGFRLNSWLLMGVATAGIALLGTAYALGAKDDSSKPASLQASKPDTHKPGTNDSGDAVLTADTTTASTVEAGSVEFKSVGLMAQATENTLQGDKDQGEETAVSSAALDIESSVSADAEPLSEVESDVAPTTNRVQTAERAATPSTSKTSLTSNLETNTPQSDNEATTDYQAVTRQVQSDLSLLGFYNGDINGLQTIETQSAMRDFKTIYGLSSDNEISGAFLNSLKRAVDDQQNIQTSQAVTPSNETVIRVAENTAPAAQFTDTGLGDPINSTSLSLESVSPVETVLAQSQQTFVSDETQSVTQENVFETVAAEPVVTERVAEIVRPEASAPSLAPSISEDTIVPARVTRQARAEYPSRVLRLNKFYDVKVYITYDVNTDGRVENARVDSMDYDGEQRFAEYFEKEAIRAVEKQRFEPRLVNGEPSVEQARTTRISFNATE